MKKSLINKLRLVVLLIFVLFGNNLFAQFEVSITKTGIQPDYMAEFADYLPSDYPDVLFTIDGNPIMDTIYIILSDPTLVEDIPCYVFARKKNAYVCDIAAVDVFKSMFNVDKQARVLVEVSGKKLYFTGTCDNAFAGTASETEGFIYIQGNASETVDIYLDDFNIKTQPKTMSGQSVNDWLRGYILGAAAPIAIGSTTENENTPFTARFHVRGTNKLTGGATSKLGNTGDPLNNMLADILYLSAAPISVRPVITVPEVNPDEEKDKEVVMTGLDKYRNIATKLTFDDIWPAPTAMDPAATIRTNGMLDLAVEGDLSAPAIDLGNAKGRCEFNGGQYKFHTPRSNSMFYVSSMAICYRSITLAGFTTVGAGGSVSAGKASTEGGTTAAYDDVIIRDGTFTTYSAEPAPNDPSAVDVIAKGWYNAYTDLRLPYNTKILGGTFNNCEVYRCDGSGEMGVPPVYVENAGTTTQKTKKTMCRTAIPVSATDVTTGVATAFADTESKMPTWYGQASLTPIAEEAQKNVYIYTPIGCDPTPPVYKRNWVTVIPKMGVEGFLTMGGDQDVSSTTEDNVNNLTTSYLLYARLNEYTKQYASITLAGFHPTVGQAIDLGGNQEFSEITNDGSYRIEKALYTMLSFNSNEWTMISLPYDVHNIYVMETTDTQIQSGEALPDFLKRQGEADGKLAEQIVTSLCPDIFSGEGSGVNKSLIEIAKTIKDPIKITPYTHGNAANSHFFLYEQVTDVVTDENGDYYGGEVLENGQGYWKLATSGVTEYSSKWQIAEPRVASNDKPALMIAGKIYTFFLPAGDDEYWNGKYLIFEGLGPQDVQGKSACDVYLKYATMDLWNGTTGNLPEDMIGLQGNITFANYTTSEIIFTPTCTAQQTPQEGYWYDFKPQVVTSKDENGNDIVQSSNPTVYPLQVYAALSQKNAEAAAKKGISRMGIISRSEDITGTTPIVGDVLLRAYSQQGSIYLFSHADQQVQIVSVDGRVVYSGMLHDGSQERIAVPTGVYVVRSTGQAIKLMVD